MIEGAILIAGPTASGKSRLALEMARENGGIVVNADSMQVYSTLRVLTARPGPEEMALVPHHLYGHVHPGEAYSTGRWLDEVEALVRAGAFAGSRPVFVGGTGLYFRALTEGLSPMPAVPASIREAWRQRLAAAGPAELHRVLAERDARAAAAILPSDGQRIVRALEVEEASGRSIMDWREKRGRPLVDEASATRLLLLPEREALVANIDRRFEAMMSEGAIDEVHALVEMDLDPAMPAMKAIGVRELAAVLAGDLEPEEAIARARAATRQYSKRQATWFRHQLGPGWQAVKSTDIRPSKVSINPS